MRIYVRARAAARRVKIYLPRRASRDGRRRRRRPVTPTAERHTILVVEDEEAVRAAAVAMLDEPRLSLPGGQSTPQPRWRSSTAARTSIWCSPTSSCPGPCALASSPSASKTLRPALPILFTSGYTDNAIVHQGRLDEGVHLISKPYARAELARRVAQLLPADASAGS